MCVNAICYCACHEHPGAYFSEPCAICGHFHSRGQLIGARGSGWQSYADLGEMDKICEYLRMFECITGGCGSPLHQIQEVIRHYATQAGRMHKGTGGWAPKEGGKR